MPISVIGSSCTRPKIRWVGPVQDAIAITNEGRKTFPRWFWRWKSKLIWVPTTTRGLGSLGNDRFRPTIRASRAPGFEAGRSSRRALRYQFVKQDGSWLFAERKLMVDRTDTRASMP